MSVGHTSYFTASGSSATGYYTLEDAVGELLVLLVPLRCMVSCCCCWCRWCCCWATGSRPSRCRFFCFIRRFWNQIFTWVSLSCSADAISIRRARVRYRLKWNSFSSSVSCLLVKLVRPVLFISIIAALLPPTPIACERVTETGDWFNMFCSCCCWPLPPPRATSAADICRPWWWPASDIIDGVPPNATDAGLAACIWCWWWWWWNSVFITETVGNTISKFRIVKIVIFLLWKTVIKNGT